jgi:dolichol-phosphate mannosyltransferase
MLSYQPYTFKLLDWGIDMIVSIIIPTYNEMDNLQTIADRIRASFGNGSLEDYDIWFIDDSQDATPQVLEQLSKKHLNVQYVHREAERGLATAVVEGIRRSRGEYVVVMDADLQHPPEMLPVILQRLQEGMDIVIPSRFVDGGADGGLNLIRKFISWTARVIGQISIRRLRNISDCTGGYFGFCRSVVTDVALDPIGWKILMEILVKGRYTTVHEVPYNFVARRVGESKMSIQEQWNYLRHIARLVRNSPEDRRFYLFSFVGALGVVVNILALGLLLHAVHFHPLASSIVASCIAMLHNFIWNDRMTWKGHANPVLWRRVFQFPQFVLVSGIGVAVTTLFAQLAYGHISANG